MLDYLSGPNVITEPGGLEGSTCLSPVSNFSFQDMTQTQEDRTHCCLVMRTPVSPIYWRLGKIEPESRWWVPESSVWEQGSNPNSDTRLLVEGRKQRLLWRKPWRNEGDIAKIIFKIFYLLIFREKGREGEREEEKHQCVVASHVPPTGDLACNPGMCSDWESNQWPFGSQASAQSTELHQPGLK